MEFIPAEKGVPIRMPSTANFMIDSTNRVPVVFTPGAQFSLANDFLIQKNNSLLNGFFTRLGVSEVYLDWNTPNVFKDLSNNVLRYDVSGVGSIAIPFLDNFYNVEQMANTIATKLNDLSGATGLGWTIQALYPPGTGFSLVPSNQGVYYALSGNLATQMGLDNPLGGLGTGVRVVIPGGGNYSGSKRSASLTTIRYLDFVSAQLTYNQELKDATTALNKDVLCRFYFCQDIIPPVDAYGFPIHMGYTPFMIRREFNTPKQIKWSANQPIGQVSFQVYDQTGQLAKFTPPTNWCMTLQVSEV